MKTIGRLNMKTLPETELEIMIIKCDLDNTVTR